MGQTHPSHPAYSFRKILLGAAGAVLSIIVVIGLWVMPTRHAKITTPPGTVEPRVVSLLPQATEILESMGCGDHLAAVSNFDDDPTAAHLPRVGDYQTTDWEAITMLRPQWLVTHYGQGRTPVGFIERADALGARRLNLITETLNGPDRTSTIYYAIEELGKTCNEPQKATEAEAKLRSRLAQVHDRVAGEIKVPCLLVIGAEGTMVAGKETFLGELLQLAGGVNVADGFSGRYPTLDREQILALRPQVIIQLLPKASPQVMEKALDFWKSMPDLPAVKNSRIVQMTDWYVLLPGYHIGDTAERFAAALHP